MASKFLLLLMCAITVKKSTALVLDTEDCGSVLGKFSSFDLNCNEGSTAELCKISPGKKYTGTLKLTPNTVINNGTITLHAIIGKTTLPFPFSDKDLCKDHNIHCPLKADTEVTVSLTLAVPSFAPQVNLVAKIEFHSIGKDLACIEFLCTLHS